MPRPIFERPRIPARTHYTVLGVSPGASTAEISKAFQALARTCHPDSATPDAAKFTEYNDAYFAIKQEHSREAYNHLLAIRFDPCPKCKAAGQRMGVGVTTMVPCRECDGAGWLEKKKDR